MWDEGRPAVVIDNGSGSCKAGLAGEHDPLAVFSSVVGRPRLRGATAALDKDSFVGDKAQAHREMLVLKYPIDYGVISNWEDMERIWHYTFDEQLGVAPEEQALLMTEAPLNPRAQKEKIAEVLFEQFSVPALFLATPALLSFYYTSSGQDGDLTGVVLESGDGVSTVVPVIEGCVQREAIQRVDLAGRDLTYQLMRMMGRRGYTFTTSALRETVREIKEQLCYVALDFEQELSTSLEKSYKQMVTLGSERFCCPEALFRPSLLDERHPEEQNLPEMIHSTVMQFDEDLRKTLYKNIHLCGGNTMFPGFVERMQKEVVAGLVSSTIRVVTHAHPERRLSAWRGGSLLASLSSSGEMYVSKQDYEESGPDAVHKKC